MRVNCFPTSRKPAAKKRQEGGHLGDAGQVSPTYVGPIKRLARNVVQGLRLVQIRVHMGRT